MSKEIRQSISGSNNTQVAINALNVHLTKLQSLISRILPEISKIVLDTVPCSDQEDIKIYEIQEKIDWNNLRGFGPLIGEYGAFAEDIDALYESTDDTLPSFRERVFKYFQLKYNIERQRLISTADVGVPPLNLIRRNADTIFLAVFEALKADLLRCENININIEELDACSLALVCHAFVECKILEKPRHVG